MTALIDFKKFLDQFPDNTEIEVLVEYKTGVSEESFICEDVPIKPDTKNTLIPMYKGKTFEFFDGIGHQGLLTIGKVK